MPRALDDLLRQTTILTLAAGIAIAWSGVELAQAISSAIVGFIPETPYPDVPEGLDLFNRMLVVDIGDHHLALGAVLDRLIAFALIVGGVMLVLRRRPAA